MFRTNGPPPSSGKKRDVLDYVVLPPACLLRFPFLAPDRHLVTMKRSKFTLRTKNPLVVINCAEHLHFQSTHFHLFTWWFYGPALCLLASQRADCGSQSLNHETELLLSKPVRRWRRLNHVIYCNDVTFVNNKLCIARSRQLPLFCSTTRPVRRLSVSAATLQYCHWLAITKWVLPGFRLQVCQNCVLLSYYEANSGSSLPTFRDQVSRNVAS
jgi:hypothetical protein